MSSKYLHTRRNAKNIHHSLGKDKRIFKKLFHDVTLRLQCEYSGNIICIGTLVKHHQSLKFKPAFTKLLVLLSLCYIFSLVKVKKEDKLLFKGVRHRSSWSTRALDRLENGKHLHHLIGQQLPLGQSMEIIKGILPQKNSYRPNLIFWIVVGCGKARFGWKGQKTPKIENFGLKVCSLGPQGDPHMRL